MFTLTGSDKNADHFACLSDDEKPTDESVRNGSDVIEMDTGNVFMFDSDAMRWRDLETGETVGTTELKIKTSPAAIGIPVISTNGTETKTAITDCYGCAKIELETYGDWTVYTEYSKETVVSANMAAEYPVTMKIENIYGASWDGSPTTKWKRTGDASLFSDPVPYVAGSKNYGSPFDNIMPWSGMVKSERIGGTMVSIPKFYYKLVKNETGGLDISISNGPVQGFSVSPAHMDRGDGKGERDIVYVGRYKCSDDGYKSKPGMIAIKQEREYFRNSIHSIGENVWQIDFSMWLTIRLLYLVEFADWDSQKVIGYGCGHGDPREKTGYTDSMPYHTGTTQSNRTIFEIGTQYRNIEGLWDIFTELCDGCYCNESGLNIIVNPSEFSDSDGGHNVGQIGSGYPSEFDVSDSAGFPIFIPNKYDGDASTYSCDKWNLNSEKPWVVSGGGPRGNAMYGLFSIGGEGDRGARSGYGTRLQELP